MGGQRVLLYYWPWGASFSYLNQSRTVDPKGWAEKGWGPEEPREGWGPREGAWGLGAGVLRP